MTKLCFEKKTYVVDDDGFLVDHDQWDEAFVEGLAPSLKIPHLSNSHWKVIHYIREHFSQYGKCPMVYETCKANKLRFKELQQLFPSGHLRGVCKLAGITYREGYHASVSLARGRRPAQEEDRELSAAVVSPPAEKTYVVNVRGFLMDPDNWDEEYAAFKSYEMGIEEPLTDRHWKIIHFLRDRFAKDGVVPTVYETCETNGFEIEDLEKLFPRGYHRGAVKLAGLKVR